MIPTGPQLDAAGLVPAPVQERASGDVLMVARPDVGAPARTAETGHARFRSRSLRALWRKGESDALLAEEAADLRVLVALHQRGLAPDAVLETLRRQRAGP